MTGPAKHTAPEEQAPTAPLSQHSPEGIAPHQAEAACQRAPTAAVGEMSAGELDAHIESLGRLVVRAMRLGDRATALELQNLQVQARAARSPAHVAAQDAHHLRWVEWRVDEEGNGYFSSDAAQAQGRRAVGGAG